MEINLKNKIQPYNVESLSTLSINYGKCPSGERFINEKKVKTKISFHKSFLSFF